MATTAFPSSSSPILLTKLTPSFSTPSHLTSLPLSFRFSLTSLSTNPRNTILHPKRCRSLRVEADEIEESAFLEDDEAEIEDEDEEEEESSIDLLFRFLHKVLRKISKKAKKATRSVLPPAISPQLVSFAVDGILLLTSLSIAKALLEVVCTLGGTVFVVILLLRLIWAMISHFQTGGNVINQGRTYDATQPAS